MSYNKIKNISISKDKVKFTSAESNIYPISYSTFESNGFSKILKEQGIKEVIKYILWDFYVGNFHSTNDNALKKYLYALTQDKERLSELNSFCWNSYDYKTKTRIHTVEEVDQAEKEMQEILYQNYLKGLDLAKENKGKEFIIELPQGYFYSKGRNGYSYKYSYTPQKTFDFLQAEIIKHQLNLKDAIIRAI